jgi:hypothetical protein
MADHHHLRKFSVFAMLAAFLLVLPACSNKNEPVERIHVVRGKVTYKGQPVSFGHVLLYSPEKSLDLKTGQFAPIAFGKIQDGKYQINHAPTGIVHVVVATDPDLDFGTLMRPLKPGASLKVAVAAGKMPGAGGDAPMLPGIPDAGPQGGPANALPMAPPGGFPPGFRPPPANPLAVKLTDEEKQTLKEIHAKYGAFEKYTLGLVVKEGEQTFDLELK